MGSGFYPQPRDILSAHGCTFARQGKGSHEIWHSPIVGKTFPVAATIMSRHLANAILKQAGIKQRL
jgi:predicted RNA binding protein YcfA (HicA-like mRNA interferase family)